MQRTLRFLVLALALSTVASTAGAQQQQPPQIHPLLKSVVENPAGGIPAVLRGPLGAHQGAHRINGQEALDLQLRTTATRSHLEALGIKVRTLHDGRATVTAPVSALAALAGRADVQSITLPVQVRPRLDKSVPETGVSSLRSQSGGVFSGSSGAGAVVGVVDSGIDVTHADFLDASGNTRILYLWDQTDSSGTAPASYGYGTEWSSSDIDSGLCTETDEAADFGHGTHVTGIAAGTGAAPDASGVTYTHTGMAPGAGIVFVKTDWSSTGIIDAMGYIFEKADALGLPAVINLSLGTQLGAHDGTNPMEQEIDSLVTAEAGRAVVVAAGNEAGDSIHSEVQAIALASVLGPDFDVPAYASASGSGNDYLYAVGYYPSTDNLSLDLWSPSGLHYTRNLNTFAFSDGCTQDLTGADGAVILCNNYRSNLGEGTSDREIVLLVYDYTASKPPANGTWSFAITGNTVAGSGTVDWWMVSGLGSGSSSTFSSHVDTAETLGIPATASEAITVGAYVTRICWDDYSGSSWSYSPAPSVGDIASFSSLGPTRDGRSKPDVAAPGEGIVSSLASNVGASLISSGYGYYVIDDYHLLLQGTSQAAPHVTGAVALLLAADPTLTPSGVKSLLRDHARDDSWTASYDQPALILGGTKNYAFGSGKLDLGSWGHLDPYETNDTAGMAYSVLSGQVLGGYVDTATDVDLFKLPDFANGDSVSISLTALADDYKLNLMRTLTLGSCGTTALFGAASSDNTGTADESIAYTAGLLVPRYIRVTSSAGGYSATVPYALKAVITRPETASAHSSTGTAQALPAHNEFKIAGGTASAAERDYYSLTAGSGKTITAGAGPLRTVQILDSSGAVLATSGFFTGASYTTPGFPFGVTHTYYVVVRGTALASSYTLTTTIN